MKTVAILMAAGMGTRMKPITDTMPKPLVQVNGKPMIETIIEGLFQGGTEEIYIVTGYLGEQFSYLTNKYSNIHFIENTNYKVMNNISSIYAAKEVLDIGNVYICEADLFISNPAIFNIKPAKSCYFGRMQEGHSEDWVFELEDGYISRVGKGGTDCYNMVGVAYFQEKDAKILKNKIVESIVVPGNEQLFWDEVVDQNLDSIKLVIEPVQEGDLVEIDTVEELHAVNEKLARLGSN